MSDQFPVELSNISREALTFSIDFDDRLFFKSILISWGLPNLLDPAEACSIL